jgi:hypothetical protein
MTIYMHSMHRLPCTNCLCFLRFAEKLNAKTMISVVRRGVQYCSDHSMDKTPPTPEQQADFSKLPKDFILSVLERLPLCDVIATLGTCHHFNGCAHRTVSILHAKQPEMTAIILLTTFEEHAVHQRGASFRLASGCTLSWSGSAVLVISCVQIRVVNRVVLLQMC